MAGILLLSACTQRQGAGPCAAGAATWSELILQHQTRYPDWELNDALKLLHQATMGSEHAVPDSLVPVRWMRQEWSTMGAGPLESVVDTLGVDGRFVRIHLRAWRDAGGSPDSLTAAFVATARDARPDTTELRCAVGALTALARSGRVPWRADRVAGEVRRWAGQGYPAVEHSVRFEVEYRPAYRVVARTLVDSLLVRGRAAGPQARPSTRRVPPRPLPRITSQVVATAGGH